MSSTPLRRFRLALLIVSLIYIAVFAITPKTVFWSPDEGAKLFQVRVLAQQFAGEPIWQTVYRGHAIDPEYQFYPRHPIYPQPRGTEVQHHWSIWFPLLSLPTYSLAGVWGIHLLPLLCGLICVWLAGRITAHLAPDVAWLTIGVVGLTSPIFFYSFLFWEHTIATALMLGAVWASLMLVSQPPSEPVDGDTASANSTRHVAQGRGLALISLIVCSGAAVALRVESVGLLFPLGLGLAIVFGYRWRTQVGGRRLMIGAVLLMTLVGIIGLIFGARVQELFALGQRSLGKADFWWSSRLHLQAVWVSTAEGGGPVMPPYLAGTGLIGLILAGLTTRMAEPRRYGWLAVSLLLLGGVSGHALFLPRTYHNLHGLFLLMPALLLATLYSHRLTKNGPRSEWFLGGITVGYLVVGTLMVMLRQSETVANFQWGSRYLLTLYPLLAICALLGLKTTVERLHSQPRLQRSLLIVSILAGLLGFGFQLRGIQHIQAEKQELLDYAHTLAEKPDPVVTNLMWVPGSLAPYLLEREFYVLPRVNTLHTWWTLPDNPHQQITYISFFDLPDDFLLQSPRPLTVEVEQKVKDMRFMRMSATDSE